MNGEQLFEFLGAAFSSVWDAAPVVFRPADEAGVPAVRKTCQTKAGQVLRLPKLSNRNAFLCGCLDFTEHESIEHLIVGLGRRAGATTKIEHLIRVSGTPDYVPISAAVAAAIARFYGAAHVAEVT